MAFVGKERVLWNANRYPGCAGCQVIENFLMRVWLRYDAEGYLPVRVAGVCNHERDSQAEEVSITAYPLLDHTRLVRVPDWNDASPVCVCPIGEQIVRWGSRTWPERLLWFERELEISLAKAGRDSQNLRIRDEEPVIEVRPATSIRLVSGLPIDFVDIEFGANGARKFTAVYLNPEPSKSLMPERVILADSEFVAFRNLALSQSMPPGISVKRQV